MCNEFNCITCITHRQLTGKLHPEAVACDLLCIEGPKDPTMGICPHCFRLMQCGDETEEERCCDECAAIYFATKRGELTCKRCGTTQEEQEEHGLGCPECLCKHGRPAIDDDCPECNAEQARREAYCEEHGHDLEASGDPENGSEDLCCKRCGWFKRVWF